MSNLWISAKAAYVPGPQSQIMTESPKPTITYVVTTLNYVVTVHTQTAPTEPAVPTIAYAVTGLNYA